VRLGLAGRNSIAASHQKTGENSKKKKKKAKGRTDRVPRNRVQRED